MRRLATDNDLHQVFAIYMHQDVVPFLGYDPMPLNGFRQVYRDLLQSGCFFVYEITGRIAGFYKASRHPGRAHHVAYLGTLAVNPEFQGQGIARRMVEDTIERLREAGVLRIELTVESDNPRAIAFYRKMGFEVEGTLRKFYKRASDAHYVDDHIMARLFDE